MVLVCVGWCVMSLHELSKLSLEEQTKYLESCSKEQLVKYSLMAVFAVEIVKEDV